MYPVKIKEYEPESEPKQTKKSRFGKRIIELYKKINENKTKRRQW